MALQDLTPQLRTRLSRLERTVGLFVGIATLLLLAALVFYVQQTAKRKGWGDQKLPYYTFVHTGAGLKVGDSVRLMGFEVGRITKIEAQPPEDSYFDVFIAIEIKAPYFGYLWEDSRAKIGAADFLGKRFIELTKGTNGPATYLFHPVREVHLEEASSLLADTNAWFFAEEVYDQFKTNLLAGPTTRLNKTVLDEIFKANSVTSIKVTDKGRRTKRPTGLWSFQQGQYLPPNESETTRKGYFLVPDEAPALTERLESLVNTAEAALPNILDLTNHLQRVLLNAGNTAARADELLLNARPLLTNLTLISANLSNPQGSLGEWIIPQDLNHQLTQTLASANAILTNSDSRVTELATEIDRTLENLATITGNLRAQVNANNNIVSEVSRLIVDTDDMVQGLKRHWLLRSAFKRPATNAPPASTRDRRFLSPSDSRRR